MKNLLEFLRKHYVIVSLVVILLVAVLVRFYNLSGVPVSLNQDEAVTGYDAYSLFLTGRDHHGTILPFNFQSFDDWVSPLLTYSTIPAVAFFGLSEFSVRLPVAIMGLISILLCYFVVEKLTKNKPIALIATLLLSIMPWHIMLSRFAVPQIQVVLYGLLFFYFGLCFWENKDTPKLAYKYLVGVILSAVAVTYSYPVEKLFMPMLMLAFVLITWGATWKKDWRKILVTCGAFGILILPQIVPFILQPQIYSARFAEVSVFSETDSNLLTRVARIGTNYVRYLSPEFLFSNNSDPYPYYRVAEFAPVCEWLAIPFHIGVVIVLLGLLKYKKLDPLQRNIYLLLIAWLALAPIAASLTATPNSLGRSPQLIMLVVIFISLFFVFLQKSLNPTHYKAALIITIAFAVFYGGFFNYYYHKVYPEEAKFYFQYGEKQVYDYLLANEDKFERVDIDGDINQAYIYYLFYSKLNPGKIDQTSLTTKIGKYNFTHLASTDIGKGTLKLRVEDANANYLEVYEQQDNVWRVILLNRVKRSYYNSYGNLVSKPN